MMKMKHFLLLILSFLSLTIVSCEKDDDGGGKSSIVGEWRLYKDFEEGYGYEYYEEDGDDQFYLIFKSDKTCKIIEIEDDEEWTESGSYIIDDDTLIVTFDGEKDFGTISSLTRNELVLDYSDKYGKYIEYYERVK